MSRISKKLKTIKNTDGKALITYIMAGDPSIEKTESLIYALEEGGADIIELGVPFSDPLADGPVIQRASERALASKTTIVKVLNMVSKVRERSNIPIVLMTYYNIIFNYDERSFVQDAIRAGVDGVIIPDLPPEEGSLLIELSKKAGLDIIFLIAPTSSEKRISLISKKSKGFIYYVSLTGVTGLRTELSASIAPMMQKIRNKTAKPVAIGFGISNTVQAAEAASLADGIVIGSAIVKIVEENLEDQAMTARVRDFASSIKAAISDGSFDPEKDSRMLGEYLEETLS